MSKPTNPSKLAIKAYETDDFTGKSVSYQVQVNPTTYSVDRTITYNATAAVGTAGTVTKYISLPPRTMKFELLFDGTGVIEGDSVTPFNVAAELKKFEDTAYAFDGKIHRPRFLEIAWGNVDIFQCVLTSLSITYKLFDVQGNPIRAVASASFTSSTPAVEIEEEADKQSPDLLHVATVRAGDTLPQLTASVYGDLRYYQEVARYNGLINLRSLRPGQQIKFPRLN